MRAAPTSLSAVAVADDGERLLFNHQDLRLLIDVPAPPPEAFGRFDAVLVDTCWPAAGVTALQLAAEHGAPGVADLDHAIDQRWLRPTLRFASHVVLSSEGLADCLGVDGLEAGIAEARRLTPGSSRSRSCRRRGLVGWRQPAPHPRSSIRAVDTLGAGDVFHGALTLALAEAQPWPDALLFATAAAAVKCSRPSGRGSFPDRADVAALLATRS
ncbi:MAG: PfkB family carbohydrate kinase [Geminicoccaceae bacterium]